MVNIAFCYSQIERVEYSHQHYEKCLPRFPNNGLAAAALRMLDSASGRSDV